MELSIRRTKPILRQRFSRSSVSSWIVSGGWLRPATRSKIRAAWLRSPNRIAAARALTSHPRIDITGLEAVIKTRYTYDTISWLLARCPGVRFVWIMGADNLRSFHRWQKWHKIAELVPIVVIDRLGPSLYAAASPAGNVLARVANSGTRRRRTARPQAARMGLSARPQIAPVLDSITRPAHAGWNACPRAQPQKLKEFKERKEAQTRETRGKKRGKTAPKRKIAAKSCRRPANKSRRSAGKSRRRQGRKKRTR